MTYQSRENGTRISLERKGPTLEPFPGNEEFKIGGAWVQIVKGQVESSSSWNLQLEVRDLVHERERLRNEGIVATEIKTVPNVISFFRC